MIAPEGMEQVGWICRQADGFVSLYKIDAEERGRQYAANNHAQLDPVFAPILKEPQKWPGSLSYPWLPSV